MQSNFLATAQGLKLHYVDWGGKGMPVLFLHGTTGNARNWGFLARHLGAGFRRLALDFRGHGDSDKPSQGYRKEDYVSDVAAWVDHLDLGPVCLVGYSLGALVSIAYGATYPEQVQGLVLVDPSIGTNRAVLAQYQKMVGAIQPSFGSRAEAQEFYFQKFGRGIPADTLEEYLDFSLVADQPLPGHYAWKHSIPASVETFATRVEDNHRYLPKLSCPTLFIRAAESQMFAKAAWEELQATGKDNFTLAQVDNADHGLMLQQPEAVAQLVAEFLQIVAEKDR